MSVHIGRHLQSCLFLPYQLFLKSFHDTLILQVLLIKDNMELPLLLQDDLHLAVLLWVLGRGLLNDNLRRLGRVRVLLLQLELHHLQSRLLDLDLTSLELGKLRLVHLLEVPELLRLGGIDLRYVLCELVL